MLRYVPLSILCVHIDFLILSKARMASAPGEAPTPVWAKDLIWESTPPFYIDWISINETRFNRCGNLKNSMNEGQAVLVGRDGQEIEVGCGVGLCKLIDGMDFAGEIEERRISAGQRNGEKEKHK